MQEENLNQNPGVVIPANHKPKKSKKGLVILLVILLLGAVGGGVYYWQQQKVQELNTTNKDLQNQLNAEKAATTTKLEEPETNATYMATIGKFSLTMSDEYVIAKNFDGQGEGGPLTQLTIGTPNQQKGIVDMPMSDNFVVKATSLDNTTYKKQVELVTANGNPKKQASIKIDGVDAEVYTTDGKFTFKHVFFTKNNIFYEVSMLAESQTAGPKLDAVIQGFKFN